MATSSLAVAQLPCLLFLFLIARAGAAGEVAVDIEGLEGDPEKNVRLTLGIVAAEGDLTAGEVERLHARAPEEIAFALEPFGYYRPTITGTLTEPEPGHFAARYVIVPGPQVHLRKVEVGLAGPGDGDSELQEAVADFPLAAGDVLLHAGYESGKNAIAFAAADNGYFDAAFDSTAILVDRDSALADIVIQFSTGPRYRFGPAELHQDILDPRVLGGYIPFEEGEPYEVEKLLDLQSGLSASPYFSRVEAKPMPERANGLEVPIEVDLEPRKTQRFDVGVGYGTDTGLRGSLDVELRRLNRRGHRAEGSIKISQIEM
ncbi:MAG TPA: POTRA domain-containing protein, partial [Candidatus Eisenbacteria bacterium]